MTLFFDKYPEFVNEDPRLGRAAAQVTSESLSKRANALLPAWIIKDKTVLDLGHCIGAFGHWSLTNGAKHYTGVDIHDTFCKTSVELLSKHWNADQFDIHCSELNEYLESCDTQYDIVLVAGVLHGYFDVIGLLKNITKVSSSIIVVETLDIDDREIPQIQFKYHNMSSPNVNTPYNGWTSAIGLNALNYVMHELDFIPNANRIYPDRIIATHDAYHQVMTRGDNPMSGLPNRYIMRYKRKLTVKQSLENKIKTKTETQNPIMIQPPKVEPSVWKFDDAVANRFQEEAINNIPDYEYVIDTCLSIANKKLSKDSVVVDVGSALGFTIKKFVNAGFDNTIGVESSEAMYNKSMFRGKVIVSETFPSIRADFVMANWTMHFIYNRKEYIQSIFDHLNSDGIFILTDKTQQTDLIKELYYDFKRSNGVSEDYIREKEIKLRGYMNLYPVDWYIETLQEIGFRKVQVINNRYNFVTIYSER